jgi:hypothetical protein
MAYELHDKRQIRKRELSSVVKVKLIKLIKNLNLIVYLLMEVVHKRGKPINPQSIKKIMF